MCQKSFTRRRVAPSIGVLLHSRLEALDKSIVLYSFTFRDAVNNLTSRISFRFSRKQVLLVWLPQEDYLQDDLTTATIFMSVRKLLRGLERHFIPIVTLVVFHIGG